MDEAAEARRRRADSEFRVKVGDKVAYSVRFLKSIGMSHSEMSRDRGVVIAVEEKPQCQLVEIKWTLDSPSKVLSANLAIVGPNMRFANCD